MKFDVNSIRTQFPLLAKRSNGNPLVYFDNAATTQKPNRVIERLSHFYQNSNANVHRGAYTLSHEATDAYERARGIVARFLGAKEKEVIFTRGTTESLNLVAQSLGDLLVNEGDTIAVTRMEHHSNFLPWQNLAKRKRAQFKIVELANDGTLDLSSLAEILASKPKILALTLSSNVLGTVNPILKISEMAAQVRQHGQSEIKIVLDAAQAMASQVWDPKILSAVDFVAFSSHKMCGPTGVGVLWGREELLRAMEPVQFGGEMISTVEDQSATWKELPWKFEAGTPNFADIIALGEAILFLEEIGVQAIAERDEMLTSVLIDGLITIPGLKIIGPLANVRRGPAVSFSLETVHPHDLATFLDSRGFCIRAGHHCAQPLMRKLGLVATARASLAFYNTEAEIEQFVTAVRDAGLYFTARRPLRTQESKRSVLS